VSGTDKVVDMLSLLPGAALRIIAGKRHLTLKSSDIALFTSTRAKRGLPLPRGFQRVDALALEE
jgi:topoisomerase-4 subunit A